MNISKLAQNEIDKFGEHVSVIFEGKKFTNVQMRRRAKQFANGLKKLGVQRGDRVVIQMPNCPEVLQSFGAIWAIGAVAVPINFLIGEEETAYIYKDSGARTVISSQVFLPLIASCRQKIPSVENVILIDQEDDPETISFRELADNNPEELEPVATEDDETAALIYTSGTTGRPKGVMHTHSSLYANARMQQDTIQLPSGLTGISVLPLCHSYGIASMNSSAMIGGGRVIVLNTFDVDAIFEAIQKYRGNVLAAVPTMYVYMLLHPKPEKYDLSSMKHWISGSAPLALDTWQQFKDKFGYEIIEGWGLTEAGANNAVNPFRGRKKVGSLGLPMKGTEMKITDDNGHTMPPGREGEIVIRGPMLMKGYWNQPEATKDAFRDGWLLTGDVGYQDEDGYFFITDRKKDLIIKGGENISPREIEEVLFDHPKISEAAVIGIKDDVYGENIKAFVVLMPGETSTAEDIIAFCQERLKRFKSPCEVEFMDALPKNLVGKVLKKELRKLERR
jgi:long-chain acyl-CoA synthetase